MSDRSSPGRLLWNAIAVLYGANNFRFAITLYEFDVTLCGLNIAVSDFIVTLCELAITFCTFINTLCGFVIYFSFWRKNVHNTG